MIYRFKRNWGKRLVVAALLVFISISAVTPCLQAKNACDRALARCSADVLLVLLFSGIQASALYSTSCLIFYDWCKKYYL